MQIAGAAAGSCLAPAAFGAFFWLPESGGLPFFSTVRGFLTLSAFGALLGAAVMSWTFPALRDGPESVSSASDSFVHRARFTGSSLRFFSGTLAACVVFIMGLPLVLFGEVPRIDILAVMCEFACVFGSLWGFLLGLLHWPAIRHAELNFTRFAHDLTERISLSALILLAATIVFGLLCAANMGTSYGQLVCSGRVLFGWSEWMFDPQGVCPQAYLAWTRFPLVVAVPTMTALWLGVFVVHERRTSSRLMQALQQDEHPSLVLGSRVSISSPELAQAVPLRALDLRASNVFAVHTRLDTNPYRTAVSPPLAFISSEIRLNDK